MKRRPLVLVLAIVIAATGAATSLVHASNPSIDAGSFSTGPIESTALYCTGLGASGSPAGRVVVLNTANHTRTLDVRIDTDTGTSTTRRIELAAHASTSVTPPAGGHWYGVSTVVNGRGVVAEELNAAGTAQTPCLDAGTTDWNANGLATTVGSKSYLVIYNPTSTAAVVNITAETPSGFVAPAPFQGVAIAAHDVVALDLGARIVDEANVGVHVRVLRSAVVVTAVQQSGSVTSFDPGTPDLALTSWFPRVTTVTDSLARILIANPSNSPATVTASVGLAPFVVPAQTVTVAPFSTGSIIITPNSAIPAHGYATVRLRSSVAVSASLATGTSGGVSLSVPEAPSNLYLVNDFAGRGFDALTVSNTGSRSLPVTVTMVGSISTSRTLTIAPGATVDLRGRGGLPTTFHGRTLFIAATRPNLIVATTLPTTPPGIVVVSPLNGG